MNPDIFLKRERERYVTGYFSYVNRLPVHTKPACESAQYPRPIRGKKYAVSKISGFVCIIIVSTTLRNTQV